MTAPSPSTAATHASKRTKVLGMIGFVPQLPPPLKMPVGN
jgi:hypothetical protein